MGLRIDGDRDTGTSQTETIKKSSGGNATSSVVSISEVAQRSLIQRDRRFSSQKKWAKKSAHNLSKGYQIGFFPFFSESKEDA
jgi:hypothetical protein